MPPLVAVAVYVTLVPAQIAPVGLAVMLTLAATTAFTVIVMELDVAGDPVTHVAFEVSTQVIISLSASAVEV